mgnify:CR=1 FL=1
MQEELAATAHFYFVSVHFRVAALFAIGFGVRLLRCKLGLAFGRKSNFADFHVEYLRRVQSLL